MAMTDQEINDVINEVFPEGKEVFKTYLKNFRPIGDRVFLEESIKKARVDQQTANQVVENQIQVLQTQLNTVQTQITENIG